MTKGKLLTITVNAERVGWINETAEKIKRNRQVVKMKKLENFVSFAYFVNTTVVRQPI